jgi:CxxC-x17-CxxC domain-containing protein
VQQAVGYADGSESAGIGGGYGQPDHQRRQTFAAVCRSCGKEAQVPIQTRGDQPVYCSDCFGSGWGSRGA